MTMKKPNGRSVTLQDIAEVAGVSRATVSMVLNDKKGIAEATRQRTLAAASRLGYVLPDRPRQLPPSVSVLIERLPTAPMADPFNQHILVGIESAARKAGYRIALEFVGDQDHVEPERWLHGWTRGVIILGGGDLGPEWVREVTQSGLPAVMVDHVVPDIPVPTVVPDNYAGAIRMTQYLIDKGHKRIGFIRGPSKYWTLSERLAGYLLAMHRAGLGPAPELVPPRISHGDEKGRGEMAMMLALPDPPTAVFAASDLTAMGAYRAAAELGLRVPDDISIAGFDDIDAARSLTPPLTTVRNPGDEMGALAFERLRQVIDGDSSAAAVPTKWTLPTTLVERDSIRDLASDRVPEQDT